MKVKSQERYSLKIDGIWKAHLDTWLATKKVGKPDDLLFPSSVTGRQLGYSSTNVMIRLLARKAGIQKAWITSLECKLKNTDSPLGT